MQTPSFYFGTISSNKNLCLEVEDHHMLLLKGDLNLPEQIGVGEYFNKSESMSFETGFMLQASVNMRSVKIAGR